MLVSSIEKNSFESLLKLVPHYDSKIFEPAFIKSAVVLKDEAHVPNKALYRMVCLLIQPILDFV